MDNLATENTRLRERINELEANLELWRKGYRDMHEKAIWLLIENKRLREELSDGQG